MKSQCDVTTLVWFINFISKDFKSCVSKNSVIINFHRVLVDSFNYLITVINVSTKYIIITEITLLRDRF